MEGQQRRTVQKGARFKIQRENKARMLVRFNLPLGWGKNACREYRCYFEYKRSMQWFLIFKGILSTVKISFILRETRNWKPANFDTKPLAETQWKQTDTFKSTDGSAAKTRNDPSIFILHVSRRNRRAETQRNFKNQVFATFLNCGNTLFHPVAVFRL